MTRRTIGIGPTLGILVTCALGSIGGQPFAIAGTYGITVWTALWWIMEPVPAWATSLIY